MWKRHRTFNGFAKTEGHKIPLFPLGLVLVPDMLLPLHIFEERYKQMIAECLAEDRPFGIVLFDGQAIRAAGCMARVTQVIKHYEDGRMDILARGGERVVIRELIEDRTYMEARVLFFDDGEEAAGGDLEDVIKSAKQHVAQLIRNEQQNRCDEYFQNIIQEVAINDKAENNSKITHLWITYSNLGFFVS